MNLQQRVLYLKNGNLGSVRFTFFGVKDVSAMISEFYYVPKNISFYIFSMFFLLISGVGKSMFQNCCNLFKVCPHIAWTLSAIPSLMDVFSGYDKCWINLYWPGSLLGTTPIGEIKKHDWKGCSLKEPSVLSRSISFRIFFCTSSVFS